MGFNAGTRLLLLAVLFALPGLKGCCESPGLKLGRFGGFMDLSFRLSTDVDLSGFTSFDLDVSIGAWAGIDLPIDLDLGFDPGEVEFQVSSVEEDIDRDGKKENVTLLAAVDPDGEAVGVFVAWKGDRYTLDKEQCYLAWVEGETMRLASAPCGQGGSVLLCSAPVDDPDSLSCQSCTGSGRCAECDTGGDTDDCRSAEPERPDEPDEPDEPDDSGPASDAGIDATDAPCDFLGTSRLYGWDGIGVSLQVGKEWFPGDDDGGLGIGLQIKYAYLDEAPGINYFSIMLMPTVTRF
jgi:hypothetical protein